MIVYKEKEISMDFIYNKFTEHQTVLEFNEYKTVYEENNFFLKVKLHVFDERLFDFIIEDKNKSLIIKNERVLINPFKIEIYKNHENYNFYIISSEHLKYVLNKLEFKEPIFNCPSKKIMENAKFLSLLRHYDCNYRHYINEKIIFENFDENSFVEYFDTKKIKKEYLIPEQFEPNYRFYFNYYEYQKDQKFKIYFDINRGELIENFKDAEFGNLTFYYGSPGQGKSITLILFLKYFIKLNEIGTLYINCKTLFKLTDIKLMKRLLKEEIIFLFKNEYDNYKRFVNLIDNYIFEESKTFWDLILFLLNNLKISNKKYIIVFDQYKKEIDPQSLIYTIFKKIDKKNFKIIGCCSMNDKDIRIMKIKKLFNDIIYTYDNVIYEEVKNLVKIENLKIDDGGIFDETLEKIGKNIKNFNILSYIYNEKNQMI